MYQQKQNLRDVIGTRLEDKANFNDQAASLLSQYNSCVQAYNSGNSTRQDIASMHKTLGMTKEAFEYVLSYAKRHQDDLGVSVEKTRIGHITEAQKQELVSLRKNEGLTYAQLGDRFGISSSYAGKIFRSSRDETSSSKSHSNYLRIAGTAAMLALAACNRPEGITRDYSSSKRSDPEPIVQMYKGANQADAAKSITNITPVIVSEKPTTLESAVTNSVKQATESKLPEVMVPKEEHPTQPSIKPKPAAQNLDAVVSEVEPAQPIRTTQVPKPLPVIKYHVETIELPSIGQEVVAPSLSESDSKKVTAALCNYNGASIQFEKPDIARAEEITTQDIKDAHWAAKPFVAVGWGLGRFKMGLYYAVFKPFQVFAPKE